MLMMPFFVIIQFNEVDLKLRNEHKDEILFVPPLYPATSLVSISVD